MDAKYPDKKGTCQMVENGTQRRYQRAYTISSPFNLVVITDICPTRWTNRNSDVATSQQIASGNINIAPIR